MSRRRRLIGIAIAAFLLYPWLLPTNWSNMGVRAAIWTLALLSLVVLTGWIGQVSLAQAALMGVGAFTAAQVTNHLSIDFPFHGLLAGAAGALVALGIGLAALRIRGLYLAIATLAFQWMLEASFLEWGPFSGGFNGIGIEPLKVATYNFSDDRLFFYLAWITVGLVILLVANLRDSRTGRAWFAIRGSEVAARTMAIDVTRYKLIGFAVSGFIVGLAGSLNLNFIGTATPFDYNFTKSITYLAVAVLGGIGAIGGAVLGAGVYIFSDQIIFSSIDSLRGKIEIVAAALLAFTLIRNPGGLISFREDLREKIAIARARRARHAGGTPLPVSGGAPDPPAEPAEPVPHDPPPIGEPILQVREVTMRFGGVRALDSVSLDLREGEIGGLIGPNGAGKTTLFNVVNGLLRPTAGRVTFDGVDITEMPAHDRAGMGMARTFQLMKLFPQLTVEENCLIATHRANPSAFLHNLLMTGRSREADARARERVREVLSLLGIAEHAERTVRGLPFGLLRLVELARSLSSEPRVLLLDEPASGLDVDETVRLGTLIRRIRDELGPTVFLIEHDMSLVMEVCDYVTVLDFGRNLASGTPDEIRENERVVAAYLGEEAVA